ncbi:MAG: di-trans,poly-cis-decaprenylcistransferase [Spirochaetes bacterium]|nr:di-trans,poly-cis-decaprenylcistransferase [Spirochaetota bacterium]
MKDYKSLIDPDRIPKHIALIMDGNRRWAEKHSLPKIEGHRKGTEVIEPLTEAAYELGVKVLSLYTLSPENWIKRDRMEIQGLMELLRFYIESRKDYLNERGVRIRLCGFEDQVPKSVMKSIHNVIDSTKNNKNIILNMCFNYGGRQDVVNAVNLWLHEKKANEKFSEMKMGKYLLTSGLPDVDLMIRTSGEFRISNFLIWQIAYSELIFLKVLWPDFKPYHLYKCIYEYQNRDRRYGG